MGDAVTWYAVREGTRRGEGWYLSWGGYRLEPRWISTRKRGGKLYRLRSTAASVADAVGGRVIRVTIRRARPPVACVGCGRDVEPARRCYARPTCYGCLPPPEPLPVLELGAKTTTGER